MSRKIFVVFIFLVILNNFTVFPQTAAIDNSENENHRTFLEMGWIQPYGIHFGFGISYFYGGVNVFW
jgi:hypothetical protein